MHDLVDPSMGEVRRWGDLSLRDTLSSGLSDQAVSNLDQVLTLGV